MTSLRFKTSLGIAAVLTFSSVSPSTPLLGILGFRAAGPTEGKEAFLSARSPPSFSPTNA
ncbi:uncharacterized protein LTR77_000368 [Saxophila tyrrhenica]|uniref:Secreted protein n=1 Tax=Saxophila tyrrhenica TaxID=1690608 RepID=A0AAV9PN55_9PEZI|nr:hypothetical protein LTR77_000368 [Saxophila tyrrhenica]